MNDLNPRQGTATFWSPAKPRQKFKPAIGRGIDIEEIMASDAYETSRTRDHLAKVLVWGGAAALITAACFSFIDRSYTPVASVWAVLGPIAGGVVSYYFYRGPKG